MSGQMSRALVPFLPRWPVAWRRPSLPALAPPEGAGHAAPPGRHAAAFGAYGLVSHRTTLRTRAQVERQLPDIIGRALARVWIDPSFRDSFAADPKAVLAQFDVHLPDSIAIEFVAEGKKRPCIVVQERTRPDLPPRRILSLQLVMLAGQ